MDKRRRLLSVLLSLTVLVSLTLACSLPGLPSVSDVLPGGEETPAAPPPVETPVSEQQCGDGVCDGPENAETCPQDCQAPPGGTPGAPPPMGTPGPFEANVEALDNLASYAYTLHFEGLSTTSGAAENTALDIQGQRQNQPTRAEQLSFSSTDGTSSTTEFVYIQDQR